MKTDKNKTKTKQKQTFQVSLKVDENFEQAYNGLIKEMKIKIEVLESQNKF